MKAIHRLRLPIRGEGRALKTSPLPSRLAAVTEPPNRILQTIADYLARAEDERIELIRGAIVEKSEATGEHALTQVATSGAVKLPFQRKPGGRWPGGWWFFSELEVQLGSEIFRPDICGYRRERMPEPPRGRPLALAPDWVCEILSPSNPQRDRVEKLQSYFQAGVPHYWIIDPVAGSLEVFRRLDLAYALPDLLLVVLFTQVGEALLAGAPDLWRRLLALVAALALVSWVTVARLVRGLVLAAREEPWVEAARASGARPARILWRHLLPNLAGPLLVLAALRVPAAILAESTVSFLGLGIQPPFASWGVLAADGFEGLRSYPHLILAPSAALAVALTAFHLTGEALRAALDPRERVRPRG